MINVDEKIRSILSNYRVIAVVGCPRDPGNEAHVASTSMRNYIQPRE